MTRKLIGNESTPNKGSSIPSEIPQLPNIHHQWSSPYHHQIEAQNRKMSSPKAKKNSYRNKKNKMIPTIKGRNKNISKEDMLRAHQYQSQGQLQLAKIQQYPQRNQITKDFQTKIYQKQHQKILKNYRAKLQNLDYLDQYHQDSIKNPNQTSKFIQLQSDTGGSINRNFYDEKKFQNQKRQNSQIYNNNGSKSNESIGLRYQLSKKVNTIMAADPSFITSNNTTPKPLDLVSGIKTDPNPQMLDDQISICSIAHKKSSHVNLQMQECQKRGKYYELGGLGPNLGSQSQIKGQFKLDTIKQYGNAIRKANQNSKKKLNSQYVDISRGKRSDYVQDEGTNYKNAEKFDTLNMGDDHNSNDNFQYS